MIISLIILRWLGWSRGFFAIPQDSLSSDFGSEIPHAVGAVGLEGRRGLEQKPAERLQHSSKVVSVYPEPEDGGGASPGADVQRKWGMLPDLPSPFNP